MVGQDAMSVQFTHLHDCGPAMAVSISVEFLHCGDCSAARLSEFEESLYKSRSSVDVGMMSSLL
jgi:hypothetical protein